MKVNELSWDQLYEFKQFEVDGVIIFICSSFKNASTPCELQFLNMPYT